MSLFGKKVTPEEYVKKWKKELKKEERSLERNIRGIELEEQKIIRSIKDLVKKGDRQNAGSAKILAKELIRSRKAKERLYASKAQINSVSMQLTQNLAMMKMTQVMQKSTQVMAAMNNLVRLPQLSKVMVAMSREMQKAGLIEEMMDDVMDNDEEIDELAEEEVDKVLEELTMGIKTAKVSTEELPTAKKTGTKSKEEDMSDLEARLGALKS